MQNTNLEERVDNLYKFKSKINEQVNNRNYTKENIEKLKRTIEIKNINNEDLNDIIKCLNSIISPDKVVEINKKKEKSSKNLNK